MALGDFVERVMDIVELLADKSMGMKLSEIAQHLDIPKSAAHRSEFALQRGFAEQDATSQRYRLTVKVAAIGLRVLGSTGTSDICQLHLSASRCALENWFVRLVDNQTLIWIAKAQGSFPRYGMILYLGNRSFHAKSVGRHGWLPG